MPEAIVLTKTERQRLARLARDADCGVDDMLREVLRDGFDYLEYKVTAINEGLADLSADRSISLDQLKASIARRRSERARARRKVA